MRDFEAFRTETTNKLQDLGTQISDARTELKGELNTEVNRLEGKLDEILQLLQSSNTSSSIRGGDQDGDAVDETARNLAQSASGVAEEANTTAHHAREEISILNNKVSARLGDFQTLLEGLSSPHRDLDEVPVVGKTQAEQKDENPKRRHEQSLPSKLDPEYDAVGQDSPREHLRKFAEYWLGKYINLPHVRGPRLARAYVEDFSFFTESLFHQLPRTLKGQLRDFLEVRELQGLHMVSDSGAAGDPYRALVFARESLPKYVGGNPDQTGARATQQSSVSSEPSVLTRKHTPGGHHDFGEVASSRINIHALQLPEELSRRGATNEARPSDMSKSMTAAIKYSGKETEDLGEKYAMYYTIAASCGILTPGERLAIMPAYWLTGEALRFYQSSLKQDPLIRTDVDAVNALERKFLDARKRQANDFRWSTVTYDAIRKEQIETKKRATEEEIIESLFAKLHCLRNVMSCPTTDALLSSKIREALKDVSSL